MTAQRVRLGLYFALLVYYFYILAEYQRIFGSQNTSFKSELYKACRRFRSFFFTGWNFKAQTVFLLVALADDFSGLFKLNPKLRHVLNLARSYFFTAIIFPSTLLVLSVFWSLYAINREWIFPQSMEEFYPWWLNHTVHGLIVLPLFIEIALVNRKLVKFQNALIGFCTFLFFYQLILLLVYVSHNIWIYPFFMHMTWTQRLLFTITAQSVGATYLTLGIYLQRLKGNTTMLTTMFQKKIQ